MPAHAAGLSPPIGAFLAGMVGGESDFRHQIEDDIRPFQDVLVGLFFVTVGMKVDLAVVGAAPLSLPGWMSVFLLGKAALVTLVATVLRWPAHLLTDAELRVVDVGVFSAVCQAEPLPCASC